MVRGRRIRGRSRDLRWRRRPIRSARKWETSGIASARSLMMDGSTARWRRSGRERVSHCTVVWNASALHISPKCTLLIEDGKDRRCVYSDGDSEDLSLKQLQALALAESAAKRKRAEDSDESEAEEGDVSSGEETEHEGTPKNKRQARKKRSKVRLHVLKNPLISFDCSRTTPFVNNAPNAHRARRASSSLPRWRRGRMNKAQGSLV